MIGIPLQSIFGMSTRNSLLLLGVLLNNVVFILSSIVLYRYDEIVLEIVVAIIGDDSGDLYWRFHSFDVVPSADL